METKIAVEESLLGPYLIADRIGQGGMATVYKAKRQGGDLQGTVVIKRMLPEHAHNPELVEMFRGEALLLASLKHTNIVQFLEFGLIDGVPYIVMEYLDGYDVAQILNRVKQLGMPFPVEAVVAIAREMCQGLGWAHEFVAPGGVRKQIIHRDVSPANVMVCRDGGIKLLDFGVAKITREFSRDITTLKGKYGYMAPEQVRGQPIDRRIDVFAAGVVLHEMLTCKRLFRGASWLETLREISAAKVRPPSETNPDVPPELDRLVMKALALKPDDRFASASEMGDALDEIPIRSMSHKKLAALLGNLFPDAWVPSSSPVEQTLVELADSDVEVIASVGPMPALSSREPTKSQRPRTDRPRRRRFTIATSAIVGTLSAVLAHFALNLTTRPAPPEIRYVPVAAAPPAPAPAAAQIAAPIAAAPPVAEPIAAVPIELTLAPIARPRSHADVRSHGAPAGVPAAVAPVSAPVAANAEPAVATAEPQESEPASPPVVTEEPLKELDRVLAASPDRPLQPVTSAPAVATDR